MRKNVSKQQEHLKEFKVLLLRVRFRQLQSYRKKQSPVALHAPVSVKYHKKASGLNEWKAILSSPQSHHEQRLFRNLRDAGRPHIRPQKTSSAEADLLGKEEYDQGKKRSNQTTGLEMPKWRFCENRGAVLHLMQIFSSSQ